MKVVVNIARILVGLLFIFSGLVKANDPLGLSYKMQEFFEIWHLTKFDSWTLALSVGMNAFEIIAGVALLLGVRIRIFIWLLLLLIVFFTFLTLYSAVTGKVTDCGCFGDALHLTPWESFTKDVILLVLILVIFINKKYIKKIFKKPVINIIVASSLVLCAFLAYHVLTHLPVIDFRAYKVGTVIREGMAIPEGAPKSEYAITFVYKVNGVEKEFTDKELDKIPGDAEFVDRKEVVVKEGYVPPIHDFVLDFNGEDMTEAILNEPKVVLVISYFLEK
ncbi:MAG: DoxX family protein, partial [Pedobacter sp.]